MLNNLHSAYMKYLAPVVGVIPVALPASIAAFSVVAMFLLVISRLDNWLVWSLGLIAAVAVFVLVALKFRIKRPGSAREQAICDFLALGGAAVWTFVNAHYAAQDIFTTRDPAIYANAGEWLIHHPGLHIPATKVFDGLPVWYHVVGQGFGHEVLHPAYLYAQGLHLLPVWLGLAGRIGGESFALGINAVFGAIALLAVYGFARLLGRPRFALLVTGILAISLPLIYFSRDTYTEPLAMLFTFSTLTLLWGAQRTRSYVLWGLAGLTAGTGVLTRTDAYLTLAALILFVAITLALTKERNRKASLKRAAVFIACALPPTIIGWLDLTHLSSGYYRDLSHQVHQEIAFVLLMAVVSALTIFVAWKTTAIQWLDDFTASWRVSGITVLGLLVIIIMASRPFWYVGHEVRVPLIGGLQAASGMPVEPTRSYAEQTVNWVGWYIGPLLTALGAAGLLLALRKIVKKGDFLLLPGLLVVSITSLVFLNLPNISPDQIWASRRLLPIILPGIAVFAVLAFEWFGRAKYKYKQAIWVVVLEMLIIPPMFVSYPFLRLKTYTPQLTQMNDICSSMPDNAAVIWTGKMKLIAIQPTEIFCGVPTVGINGANQSQLKEIAQMLRAQGKTPVIGLTDAEKDIYFPSQNFTAVNTVSYTTVAESLYHPPRHTVASTRTIIVGNIKADGTIAPLKENNVH